MKHLTCILLFTLFSISAVSLADDPISAAQSDGKQMQLIAAHVLPNPAVTPGVVNPAITQANIGANICNPHWSTKSIRPPSRYTSALKRQQLEQRGYADKVMSHAEEDHLISLEIGGSPTDPKNLWPQPYAGQWGARVKDKIENRLHKLVCTHQITLQEAQMCISSDWIACYRRYLGSPP